jgi:hypothetical protein
MPSDCACRPPSGHPSAACVTIGGPRPARADDGGEDGAIPTAASEEDDVTEPGTVPEADRAEQEALVDPPEVAFAGDAQAPPADVPEADALDQQLVARPRGTGGPLRPVGDREADDADVLDQETDVPVAEDDPEL